MKHFLFLIAAAALATTASQAQSLKVYTGHTAIVFPASAVGDMQYASNSLSIGNYDVQLSAVDSVVVDRSTAPTKSVVVEYNDARGAFVTLSSDVANFFDVSQVTGNHVTLVANNNLADEVNYVLTGTTTQGSFYMDGEYKSTITLNNLHITNPDSAAICIDNGKRINVVLTDGTTNSLVDGVAGPQKACFFINGHAEFKGAGTLNITGNTKHAYASDEYTWLKPTTGTITITATAGDGLHVDQYFKMDGGTLSFNSIQGDCIDVSITKDATDEYNGQVFINGGTLNLTVAADDVKGLKSESDMTIQGGTIHADVTGNGCKGFSVGGNLLIGQAEGATTAITMNVAGTTYHKGEIDESKCRGIKVKGYYTLAGGSIKMNVTGKKAKGIAIDGTYSHTGGTTNVQPE